MAQSDIQALQLPSGHGAQVTIERQKDMIRMKGRAGTFDFAISDWEAIQGTIKKMVKDFEDSLKEEAKPKKEKET